MYIAAEALMRRVIAVETRQRVVPGEVTVASSDARDRTAWLRADILFAGRLDIPASAQIRNLKLAHCSSAGAESYLPLDWLSAGGEHCDASGVLAESSRRSVRWRR